MPEMVKWKGQIHSEGPATFERPGPWLRLGWRHSVDSLPDSKRCTRCGEWRSRDQYSKSKRTPDGVHGWCQLCNRVYQHQHYAENRERYKADGKRRYEQNAEQIKDRVRAYRVENTERCNELSRRWGERNPEKRRAIKAAWKKRNPEQAVRDFHRRKTRLISSGGSFTKAEWRALCQACGNVCLACGVRARLTVDHVTPVALGGSNDIDNIQPLCGPCNWKKNARTIDYRLDRGRFIPRQLLLDWEE